MSAQRSQYQTQACLGFPLTSSYGRCGCVSTQVGLCLGKCGLKWDEIIPVADTFVYSSVGQLCLTLWDPMDCSMPGFPCPSPIPGACSNSCPLSRWCHPTISSSVISFSSCLQSFPASGSFQMSHFFASGGQSIGVSASASVLPMNIQDWFPLGLTYLISLQSKGLSRVFSNTLFRSISSSVLSFLYGPTLTAIHDYWKNHSFDNMDYFWNSNVYAF